MNHGNEQLEQDFSLAELLRMVKNIIRIGTVVKLDEKNRRKVRCDTGDEGLTDWLPWIVRRAHKDNEWWCPEKGEQVVILSPGGDMAQGIVLPSLYRQPEGDKYGWRADKKEIYRQDFWPGNYIRHDRETGDIDIVCTGTITLYGKQVLLNPPGFTPKSFN